MDSLILHESTLGQLAAFLARPSHAILLTGQQGAGKGTVASVLARKLLGLSSHEELLSYPYFKHLHTPGTSWSIDTVRSLNEFLKLKTTGEKPLRRIVIFEEAHLLTTEAQNALLKLLEEPPKDTAIIMTATNAYDLLPTITSRVQKLSVEPLTLAQALQLFEKQDKATVERAYHMSGGGAGLLSALLQNDEEHPLVQQITEAKDILRDQLFERLCRIERLIKQRTDTLLLIQALRRVCSAALLQAASKENTEQIKRWHSGVKHCYEAEVQLSKNAQPKLVLTNLFLNL